MPLTGTRPPDLEKVEGERVTWNNRATVRRIRPVFKTRLVLETKKKVYHVFNLERFELHPSTLSVRPPSSVFVWL